MPAHNDQNTPPARSVSASPRARRRRRVVENSTHRDEYDRLMQAGWSSISLERYAKFRYGEDVPASTLRSYRQRQPWVADSEVKRFGAILDPERAVDVLGERAALIQLQIDRIAIDVEHEKTMSKLFGSTRGEIATLSSLLDAHKADLQDMGVMGKAGDLLTVQSGPKPEDAPKSATLGEALGVSPGDEAALARRLHLVTKPAATGTEGAPPAATNGTQA